MMMVMVMVTIMVNISDDDCYLGIDESYIS